LGHGGAVFIMPGSEGQGQNGEIFGDATFAPSHQKSKKNAKKFAPSKASAE
jgi:hypothetical protein